MPLRLPGFPLVVAVLVLGLSLAACGKKGRPEVPEDSTYPRKYPKAELQESTRRPVPV
ncbi:MAG: hypothetical protein ABT940_01995 [Alphaproteobacteria bacterium]